MLRLTLILFLLVSGITLSAQSCVDSFNVSSTYVCPTPDFNPVCGCDGKTYRNLCEAQYRHGIQRYTDGSCSGFEIDILPNLADQGITFTLVQTRIPTFVRMAIMDGWGKIWVYRDLTIEARHFETLDVTGLPQGVYFLFVYDSFGNYRYRKFVVYHQ